MTNKARLAALEAVAEAAANYRKARLNNDPDMIVISKRSQLYNALYALYALDALPAQPPGETVEVYGVIKDDDGVIYMIDHSLQDGYAGHVIANVTARVLLPTVPTITVTLEVKP
jgi:hypothetical protein